MSSRVDTAVIALTAKCYWACVFNACDGMIVVLRNIDVTLNAELFATLTNEKLSLVYKPIHENQKR